MRMWVMLLLGLLIGAAFTLIGINALRKGTAYPNGVMAVMAAQMKVLDESIKQNRCAATDLIPRLQTLRYVGNDLEPAFLPTQDDTRFISHASELRASLDAALASSPAECTAARLSLDRIGKSCQACHQDFKN